MVLLQRLNKLPVGGCLYLCFCSCKQCCFITKEIAEWLLFNYLNISDLINILQIHSKYTLSLDNLILIGY